jgi:flagellar motor switch protein FliG
VERSVLGGLEEEDAQMVAEIREYMFTWEDLASLDKRAMQKVLTSVDTRTLSIALKGSSTSVEENILSNLSSRVREMVAEERELAGPMPMSEVQVLRDEVMKAVRGLMESGEIKTTRAGEDLVT